MNDIFFPRNRSLLAQPLEVTTQPPTFLYSKSLSFFFFFAANWIAESNQSPLFKYSGADETHTKKKCGPMNGRIDRVT